MHNIKILDKLLKNELLATEAYQQALDKLRNGIGLASPNYITPIYQEHKNAVSSLQAQIRQQGGIPSEKLGAWKGTWAKMVIGGANLLGKETALKTLQEGEKRGAEDYEEALQNTELSSDMRSLIETKLLPTQQEHICTLDRLLDAEAAV
ncbi:DUF2383 domain-containing protein [Crenothrix polyspora]|uniref:DUF2383 domain-containing protein n=1 Tax=Crenothrix polyspora TaxID=360316 RepID=A0A1R4H276_9GAMM|nr:DUF2383 domain-containing protein [Crenothrix polyspora]SJM90341.1 conserved hypothetical protein [Crenothrix polyspora]